MYVSNQSDQDVYFDNLQVGITAGNIIEENHYYAYGLKIAGISSKKLGDSFEGMLKNNNLYNDKELFDDGDLNWYDYGFRNYDPQIGRFTQLDPLTDDYPELTPYQYASNDPIGNIDIDGLEGGVSTFATAGEAANAMASFVNDAHVLGEVVVTGTRVSSTVVQVGGKASSILSVLKTLNSIRTLVTDVLKVMKEVDDTKPVGKNIHSSGIFQKTVTFINSDADGSEGAYNLKSSKNALDYSENAKNAKTGKWSKNVIAFEKGEPKDFGGGNLLAKSSFHLKTKSDSPDPENYLDSRNYSYFVLGGLYAEKNGIELGDIAMVQNLDNGHLSYAIYGDSGPNNFTEGSILLINSLGHPGFKSKITGAKDKTIYGHFKFTVFKKSGVGNGHYISQDDINRIGKALKEKFKL